MQLLVDSLGACKVACIDQPPARLRQRLQGLRGLEDAQYRLLDSGRSRFGPRQHRLAPRAFGLAERGQRTGAQQEREQAPTPVGYKGRPAHALEEICQHPRHSSLFRRQYKLNVSIVWESLAGLRISSSEEAFLFEKKNQSFLVLFFKKGLLAFFLASERPQKPIDIVQLALWPRPVRTTTAQLLLNRPATAAFHLVRHA